MREYIEANSSLQTKLQSLLEATNSLILDNKRKRTTLEAEFISYCTNWERPGRKDELIIEPSVAYLNWINSEDYARISGKNFSIIRECHHEPKKWTLKEVKYLKDSIEYIYPEGTTDCSTIDWHQVEKFLDAKTKRTARDCRLAWTNQFGPHATTRKWTKCEEKRLLELVYKHREHDWESISREMGGGRTAVQCLKHYQQSLNASALQSVWSTEDDRNLKNAVAQHGPSCNWFIIAQKVPGRSPQQCQVRWNESLKAESTKSVPWSLTELRRLCLCVRACSNRKDVKHGNSMGTNWVSVAKFFGETRSPAALRDKWMEEINPFISKGNWTEEEDNLLKELVGRYGEGCWSEISKHIPSRTDYQIRHRWKHLCPEHVPKSHVKKRGGGVLPPKHQRRRKEAAALTVDDFDGSTPYLPAVFKPNPTSEMEI